jgi:aminocarboxymuconate-semialdehyde decarboxylase
MVKIDLHTHILPPPSEWPDLSSKFGYAGWIALEQVEGVAKAGAQAAARMVRVEGDPARGGAAKIGPDGERVRTFFREVCANCWDPAVRLEEMDRCGVDAQVLSTVPVMFSYWARPSDALDVSRWLNDHLAGVVGQRPDRFAGLGTVPLNAPELAVKELERCVLELGMPGVQIGTNVGGKDLGDPSLFEVFKRAEELGACVFVHPWDMLQGCEGEARRGDAETRSGGEGYPRPFGVSARLREHWMAWLVGMPAETGLAVCSVLFGGLLEKLPTLRIGFAHGAGCFPGCVGRIEHGFHARPDLCQTRTRTPPREHLLLERALGDAAHTRPARFYADSLVHDPDALRMLVKLLGAERVALGSDYPFPLGEDRPGEMIEGMGDLDRLVKARLLGETAMEFLGERGKRLASGRASGKVAEWRSGQVAE